MRRDVVRRLMDEQLERQRAPQREAEQREVRAAEAEKRFAMKLTGQPVWDRYLEKIGERQQLDVAELETLQKEELSGDYFTPEQWAKRHHRASVLRAKIEARNECAGIPEELLGRRSEA